VLGGAGKCHIDINLRTHVMQEWAHYEPRLALVCNRAGHGASFSLFRDFEELMSFHPQSVCTAPDVVDRDVFL
jgi:hypothetical protein